jgi:hypothetical protein
LKSIGNHKSNSLTAKDKKVTKIFINIQIRKHLQGQVGHWSQKGAEGTFPAKR